MPFHFNVNKPQVMRVSVPLETVVYKRRNARECFVLQHIYKGSYIKHVPWTLSVGDLRQHAINEARRSEQTHTPLLVLVTGKLAMIYTLANWNSEKQAVQLRWGEFGILPFQSNTPGMHPGVFQSNTPGIHPSLNSCPDSSLKTIQARTTKPQCNSGACSDLSETHALIHTYSALVTYGVRESKYIARGASCVEASCLTIPRRLPACEVHKLENIFRHSLEKAKRVATWVLEDTGVQYNEVARRPKRRREED